MHIEKDTINTTFSVVYDGVQLHSVFFRGHTNIVDLRERCGKRAY